MKVIHFCEVTGPLRDYLSAKSMVAAVMAKLEVAKWPALQQLLQIIEGGKSLLVLTNRNVLQVVSQSSEHRTYDSDMVRLAEENVASALARLEAARRQAEEEGKFRSVKSKSIRVQILTPANAKRMRDKYVRDMGASQPNRLSTPHDSHDAVQVNDSGKSS